MFLNAILAGISNVKYSVYDFIAPLACLHGSVRPHQRREGIAPLISRVYLRVVTGRRKWHRRWPRRGSLIERDKGLDV
jgi:hypothetical protein